MKKQLLFAFQQSFTCEDMDHIISVKEKIDGQTYNHGTEYDVMGWVKKETYPSGYYMVTHYDSNSLFYKVTDRHGRHVWEAQTENAQGQLTSEKKGNRETVITGALTGAYSGGVIANDGQYNPTKWNYSSGKTWSYMLGGCG
jgi:hypothetical protein